MTEPALKGSWLRSFGPIILGPWTWLVFCIIGVSVSLFAAHWVRKTEYDAAAREFARSALARHQFLANSFGSYESVLYTLQILLRNSREITPLEFERAAADIQKNSPSILALQWVPLVENQDLPAFARRMRELHRPDFTLRELTPSGTLSPLTFPGTRDQHAIIAYSHPAAGNELTFGYDIFTAPTAPDLHRALQTRLPALTRPITLVQGEQGVILTAYADRPILPSGPPLSGPGFVQVVMRLSPMLNELWNISPQNHIDFALYDITGPVPVPLYVELADTAPQPVPLPSYEAFTKPDTVVKDLRVGGRSLRACYRPGSRWLAQQQTGVAPLFFVGGLLLTLSSVALVTQLRRRTLAVERQVALRTAELGDSRALLNSVVENSPNAIWVKDSDLRFFLVNGEFCQIYKLDRARILGRSDHDFYDAATVAEMERLDREILSTGKILRFENSYNTHGEIRTYLVGKFPLRHTDGSIYAVGGIATDITALRQTQTEKNAIERRLLEAQKLESLGILAGGIAHDFNNLLTGILGHASLLSATLPHTSGAHASIAQIEAASRRAADLCRHMLAYSGRGSYVTETISPGAFIQRIFPLLQAAIPANIRLLLDLAPDLPFITADLAQLRQALTNFVVNASEAIAPHPGDITLRTRRIHADESLFATCVHAPALPPGDYIVLEISDTGCGMNDTLLPRIFDPFFTTKFAGRGLGLAAALGIIRGHKGALRVTTQTGQGSTFHLYLPAVADTLPAPPNPTPPPPPPSPADTSSSWTTKTPFAKSPPRS